jgi:lipopolysaccharide export LptBFGC system permease protein LptF
MTNRAEIACKWATCGVLFIVFFGLVALAGCINVVEFFGSILAASLVARLFYFGISRAPLKIREFQHNGRFA